MKRKSLCSVIIVLLLVLTTFSPVYAAETVPWKIEKIGTFDVPQALEKADIWEVGKMIQALLPPQTTLKQENLSTMLPNGKAANPFESLQKGNLRLYQLTINDKKAYHTAVVIFFTDEQHISTKKSLRHSVKRSTPP
jgi:hypothetical protein